MPVYAWKGVNRKGQKKKGEMDAENENFVRLTLRRQGVEPSSIKPKPKDILEGVKLFQPRVTEKDIVVMTRQFATMIDAGLPLVQCLDILYSQQDNRTFKRILKQIKDDVEEGSTFADALKKHPDVFDELFVNLVAAGEIGGILDVILNRLANYIEKAAKLKKKVKGAMVYPLVVMIIAVCVVAVILIFVIPVFQQMFADFGRALPAPTQFVVNLSNFVKSYIIYIVVMVALCIFAFRRFYRTERGRTVVDDLVLKAPVFGVLIRKVAVAKFTRTLGTMISSGVPILDSLDIVAATAGNKTIETALRETRMSISEGRTIAEPLADSDVFPAMVVQMISVGEATGALDTMLTKIADFYDDEVDAAVEALTAMLEPFMMVFLGGTIGGLVVSMYLPIFQMAGAVGG
ncbi:MAG TPA: type II secretion system F family protein [Syntrophobacteria bacterium]|nr:type II secretion system F family protein [Syntrophobacteria bacterium]